MCEMRLVDLDEPHATWRTPRATDRLAPWRCRLWLWKTRSGPMRFIHYPEAWLAGFRNLYTYDQIGLGCGRLVLRVYDACQRAAICKISLNPDDQRQGYGRRLVLRALCDGLSYLWTTSGQSADGARFFAAMSGEIGAASTSGARTCGHITSNGPATTSQSRPALGRSF